MLLIRLECMVRKLLKSTDSGNPSFLIVGLSCRFRRFRRLTGPPFVLVNTRSPGLRVLDLCHIASKTPRKIPIRSSYELRRRSVVTAALFRIPLDEHLQIGIAIAVLTDLGEQE